MLAGLGYSSATSRDSAPAKETAVWWGKRLPPRVGESGCGHADALLMLMGGNHSTDFCDLTRRALRLQRQRNRNGGVKSPGSSQDAAGSICHLPSRVP
jgi:hypothetical protein